MTSEPVVDIQKETEEIGELLEDIGTVVDMTDPSEERFYPINRAARRKQMKRDRALQKRNPRG